MKHLSGNGKQQGNRRWQSISASILHSGWSQNAYDVQMLFDPFEETFHLPTFL